MSNKKYRWHSSEGSCEKCQALNNKEYNSESEIPDKPHPHCKCYVEVIEEDTDKCDCILDAIEGLCEIIGEARILKEEIIATKNEFHQLLLTYKRPNGNVIILENIRDALEQLLGTISDFINNYIEMVKVQKEGADKYYHAKANCEGAQRGKFGELTAKAISDLRELTDLFRNIVDKGLSAAEILKDMEEDQAVNRDGREQGKNNPDDDSRILVDKHRPPTLPKDY